MSTPTPTLEAKPRVTSVLGGRALLAYGALAMAIGAAQAVRSGDTSVEIATGMRIILLVFALSLLVLVPSMLALGRFASSMLGPRLSACGTPLLALGAASSAINGSDLAWFPAVAVVANALWFIGTLITAVSLWRARRVPRWVAGLLPLTMPVTLFLSQLGGGLLAGAFFMAVGVLMTAGRFDRR